MPSSQGGLSGPHCLHPLPTAPLPCPDPCLLGCFPPCCSVSEHMERFVCFAQCCIPSNARRAGLRKYSFFDDISVHVCPHTALPPGQSSSPYPPDRAAAGAGPCCSPRTLVGQPTPGEAGRGLLGKWLGAHDILHAKPNRCCTGCANAGNTLIFR